MNIYELTAEYTSLEEWFDDEELDEETLLDTLEGIEGEFNDKIENYCKVIKNFEANAKAIKDEAKRLQARAKTFENKIGWMKKRMLDAMEATGKTEAGGQVLKAKIAKNGGKLPLELDEENVPVTFKKIEYKIDNEAIRKALDDGEELDFAHYGERGRSLRIK